MPTEFSIDTINDYFTKLNPIARKISLDIDETKSAYEHIWAKLNSIEHNEIINETLMKPEISLRYFDNFSIATSASSLSFSSIVTPSQAEQETSSKKPIRQPLHHHHQLATRRFYDFDGRNLSSYAEQKVGLKVIHDEILGTFRDGHSMPFSYKTKSQINLRLFQDDDDSENSKRPQPKVRARGTEGFLKPVVKAKDLKPLPADGNETLQISAEAYKKLQTELATNLSSRQKTESAAVAAINTAQNLNSFDKIDAKYQRFYNESQVASNTAVGNQAATHNEPNLLKLISKTTKPAAAIFHHSKYGYDIDAGDDEDEYERVNLMMNCCNQSAGGMTTSSSSAPSEDDEKTLCEDLKLLLDNDGLRKGFDFLNNW